MFYFILFFQRELIKHKAQQKRAAPGILAVNDERVKSRMNKDDPMRPLMRTPTNQSTDDAPYCELW